MTFILENVPVSFLPDQPKKEPMKEGLECIEKLAIEGINWPMFDYIRNFSFDSVGSSTLDGYVIPHGFGQRSSIQKM